VSLPGDNGTRFDPVDAEAAASAVRLFGEYPCESL
jgi:hypothetical protein